MKTIGLIGLILQHKSPTISPQQDDNEQAIIVECNGKHENDDCDFIMLVAT